MIFRWIQYIGIGTIVLFSAYSSFLAFYLRESDPTVSNTEFSKSYASFFEERFFDLRMKLTLPPPSKQDKRIVLAAIDDESLNKVGRWPWPRTRMADLVDKLNGYGAKVVAFDIFFSEPEVSCKGEPSSDTAFAEAIKRFQTDPSRKIILPYSVGPKMTMNSENENEYFKELPDSMYFMSMNAKSSTDQWLLENVVQKKVFPIEELTSTEAPLAHIEASTDHDGVFRHYQLVANVDKIYVPSFSLLAYQHFTGDNFLLEVPSIDGAYLATKNGKVFLNQNGEAKVRWLGGTENFPIVSIYDIFRSPENDPKMKQLFNNTVVFVGSTAFGAHDLRNTPVNQMLPGVIFHMNMLNMLLDGRFYVNNEDSNKVTWAMLLIGTSLMIVIMFFNNAILDFVFVNVILGAMFVIDAYYFIPRGYNNKLFFSMFSVLGCYSWSTFLHFYQSNKEKQKIKGTFSRYLAPSIINDLLKNPEKLRLGGEKKNITVFFSDVRDFTTISEKLTPEQLSQALNMYMTMMTDTLFEHKGTLDKYIGDAMVAYWGAPVDLPDNAYWAIKGAIEMIERLPPINEEFKKLGFPLFKHGIGLNTGECSVGNMGSNQIFSYTALGDNMNLGARLESLCKFYGVQLNVSEYTIDAIPENKRHEFVYRTLDKVKVKGKEKAVTIYEIMHPSHPLYNCKEELKLYEEGFQAYLQMEFEKATNIFQSLLDKFPEDPTFERMLTIAKDFNEVPPPPGWDGTFTHKSK